MSSPIHHSSHLRFFSPKKFTHSLIPSNPNFLSWSQSPPSINARFRLPIQHNLLPWPRSPPVPHDLHSLHSQFRTPMHRSSSIYPPQPRPLRAGVRPWARSDYLVRTRSTWMASPGACRRYRLLWVAGHYHRPAWHPIVSSNFVCPIITARLFLGYRLHTWCVRIVPSGSDCLRTIGIPCCDVDLQPILVNCAVTEPILHFDADSI